MERSTPTKYRNLLLLLIISISLLASPSRCCLQRERAALLELKSHFMSLLPSNNQELAEKLSSWGDHQPNCCSWSRVTCDGPLQHVTALSLDQLYLCTSYSIPPTPFCALNVSLFHPFEELMSLNLSQNNLHGLVGHRGNRELNLRNLEIFDFGYNIVIQLEELVDFLGSLTSLKGLFLRDNRLGQSFAKNVSVLVNLKQLQVLDLSLNYMDMNVHELFSALPNWKELQVLYLSSNHLTGTLSEQGFLCGLQKLQELHLRDNSISGNLPRCIGDMTSLRVLDISFNNLSGDIPPIFQNLDSLESLLISDNSFSGEFSLNSFLNHSNLGVLVLTNNRLNVKSEDPFHRSSNFQPQTLELSNCNLNSHRRSFLKFLSQMQNLQVLDISHNGLVGSFPTWLLLNNSNLKSIMLRNNSFTGVLRLPKDENQSLVVLDVSDNNFYGSFPENIGTLSPSIQYLNASENHFEGKIPVSVGNMTTLKFLDLSNNHFSGDVPKRLLTHCGLLNYLKLSNNSLEGEIIPGYMNLTLSVLYLNGNHFTGTITNGVLESASELMFIDISNNEVTGDIPTWIGNFSRLKILAFSYNHLEGKIPSAICNLNYLVYLELSNNRLTGPIPSCYSHSLLVGLHLHNNFLSGSIPHGLTGSPHLLTLDLSGNHLSRGIPSWLGNVSELQILLLGHNSLRGELPETLCQLEKINIMDLSVNEISGGIPSCFTNMSFGAITIQVFEVSISYEIIEMLVNLLIRGGLVDIKQEGVSLLTKSNYYDYKGNILNIMSMLDLSCNQLTGKIPKEIGHLDRLITLNLSHNEFYGSIPSSFSMLKSIESLDLSYNTFSGWIPSELDQVTTLEIFNVSYNKLSGMVPEKGQFASFDESSYMGNPLLCGFIGKSCVNTSKNASLVREDDGSTSGFDWQVFLWSFGMSSITFFLAILVVLSINPQWRGAWFLFLDLHVLWWLY